MHSLCYVRGSNFLVTFLLNFLKTRNEDKLWQKISTSRLKGIMLNWKPISDEKNIQISNYSNLGSKKAYTYFSPPF